MRSTTLELCLLDMDELLVVGERSWSSLVSLWRYLELIYSRSVCIGLLLLQGLL